MSAPTSQDRDCTAEPAPARQAPPRLRLTFVLASYEFSGGVRVLATYADRLGRRGHDVTIVAPPPPLPPLRSRVKRVLAGRAWPRYPLHVPSFFDGTATRCVLLDRHRAVDSRDVPDADLVIATWWETAEWVSRLPGTKGAKVHLIQGQEGSPDWFDAESIPRARAVYSLPLQRITISRSLVDWLKKDHGCSDVRLVPNAVDLELFHAPERGKQAAPTVGFIYSDSRPKGLVHGLEALRRVQRRLPDVRFVAFGFPQDVASPPLPKGTHYEPDPPQERLRHLYAQCDVWMCCSLVEGFTLPPLEAMACRCPVVSTRVGGPDQLVVDNVNGYLVPVGAVDALADRLVDILTLPDAAWRRMSDAAHAAATGYSWEDATDRLESALREILVADSKNGRPPPSSP